MITLITAVPGSGKSLYCIDLILKAIEQGRPVYSNIEGLLIDKCLPAPDDWRDTPEGALVIYDEAQQPHLYPSTARRGEISDDRLRAMEVHRHTGHDLVFVSQAPSFLHHHIRKLAGEHIHLYRVFGLQASQLYKWAHCCDSPNDRTEQGRSDSFRWNFPRSYYKLYKSATVHTHKFKMPKKLAFMLLALVLLIAAFFYLSSSSSETSFIFANDSSAQSEPVDSVSTGTDLPSAVRENATGRSVPASTTEYDWAETEVSESVAGCVYNDRFCRCYSSDGKILKMGRNQCLSVAVRPIPRDILVNQSSKGNSNGHAGQGMVSGSSQEQIAFKQLSATSGQSEPLGVY